MARKSRARSRIRHDAIRLPLPGQSYEHEHDLRQKLIEQFQPQDVVEEIWLEDIACCQARIDHDRAVIAAFRMRCIKQAYEQQFAPVPDFESGTYVAPELDPSVEGRLDMYADNQFVAPDGLAHTGDNVFAMLLGQLSGRELSQLRLLQIMLQEEMQERDRIINQLRRSRRQAMRDAIDFAQLLAPAQEAAALAGPQENDALPDGRDSGERDDPQPGAAEPAEGDISAEGLGREQRASQNLQAIGETPDAQDDPESGAGMESHGRNAGRRDEAA